MSMFQCLQFCVQLGAASLWGPEDVAKQGNTELQASKASIYGIVLELARVVLSKAFTPAANGTCVCCVVGPGVSKSPKRSTWPGMHFMEAWWKPGTHVMLPCCTTKGFKRTTRITPAARHCKAANQKHAASCSASSGRLSLWLIHWPRCTQHQGIAVKWKSAARP